MLEHPVTHAGPLSTEKAFAQTYSVQGPAENT